MALGRYSRHFDAAVETKGRYLRELPDCWRRSLRYEIGPFRLLPAATLIAGLIVTVIAFCGWC